LGGGDWGGRSHNHAGALGQEFLKTRSNAALDLGELKQEKRRFDGGLMSVYDRGGKVDEEGTNMARAAIRKGEAKAEQTLVAAQEGFQIAGDGARQMNLKMLEMMRANAEAFFNFAEELVTARDPSKLTEIWTTYAQTQMQMLTKNGQDLTSLGQKVATTSANTMTELVR
jgi:hypothetical protein